MSRGPVRLFISYSHADDPERIQLEKQLKVLQRDGLVESWSDRKLLPGQPWGQEIEVQLERADGVLLLISAATSRRWSTPTGSSRSGVCKRSRNPVVHPLGSRKQPGSGMRARSMV